MNTVKLFGRIGNELQNKGEGDKKRLSFLLAVKKNETEANWIQCVAFNKTADLITKYCKKGDRLIVEGHLQSKFYETENEKSNLSMNVVVDTIHFVEYKNKEASTDEIKEF